MDESDLVEANRNLAFPPLRHPRDSGLYGTKFEVWVPFRVNIEARAALLDSLKAWVHDQGLDDFVDRREFTYIAGDYDLEPEEDPDPFA